VYAVLILAAYKMPAGILAACAGLYGRKNTRGKYPRAFYFDILANLASTTIGKSMIHNNAIFTPPLEYII
jgi:hypothetical protein